MKRKMIVTMGLILWGAGCARLSIQEINFYDEKTALENQILGTYKELESDPWLTTSVRSQSSATSSPVLQGQSLLMDAFRQRALISGDLDRLRAIGLIRERFDGRVSYHLDIAARDEGQVDRDLAERLVGQENSARQVIIAEIVKRNPNLESLKKEVIDGYFRDLFVREAPPGTWFEENPDQWRQKKSELKEE